MSSTRKFETLDSSVAISDSTDPTKKLKFDVSGITTGTTRTFTVPDTSATMATTTATLTSNAILKGNGTTSIAVSGVSIDGSDNISGVVNITSTGYTQLTDISAPSNAGDGKGRLYKLTGDDGIWWKPDLAGPAVDLTASGGGEANTASSAGGTSLVLPKSGVDLPFKGLTATSSKIALAANANDIGIDVTEANLTLDNIGGTLSVANGGTGATTFTSNAVLTGNTTSAIQAEGNLLFDGSDLTLYEAVNDGNPSVSVGSSSAETLVVQSVYDGGAQTLDKVTFTTKAASATADKGKMEFLVDETLVATIDDDALDLASGKVYEINGTSVLSSNTLGSGVTSSSLTSVGTISTGVWNGTAIAAANGGTGQTSYNVGDLVYASGTTTISKLAGVATGNALISGGVSTAPSYGKIGLTTHISGTLGVGNGGTGATSFANNFLQGNTGTAAVTAVKAIPAGVVVGTTDPQTLTTKTMTDNTNNVIARALWIGSGSGSVSTYAASAPSTGQVLTATGATTATWQTLSKVIRTGHTWAIYGEIKVASGQTNFLNPFFISLATGQTATIALARHKLNSGTSATVKITKNDIDVTGFTGISVTTTAATTDPANVAVASGDKIALVVTGVAGTPVNMSFTLFIENTV